MMQIYNKPIFSLLPPYHSTSSNSHNLTYVLNIMVTDIEDSLSEKVDYSLTPKRPIHQPQLYTIVPPHQQKSIIWVSHILMANPH